MMTNWIISSSALILLLMLVRLVFREKMSQRLRYALWLLVLIRLLVPFSLGETEISIDNFTEKAAMSEGGQIISEIGNINLPQMSYNDAYAQVASEYSNKGIDIEKMPVAEYERVGYEIDNLRRGDISIGKAVHMVWITGICIFGGIFALSNMVFASKLRKNRRPIVWQNNRLPIFVTDKVDTPCLFDIFRPTIYVTDETMADYTTLHHVVEHELTHFRHGDHIWAIMRGICLAIHWYNPLVWAAAFMSKNDAELACDEATIKRIGEDERAEYGRTLIMMTCEKRPALFNTATTMTGSGRTIRERISLIVKKPKMAAYTLVIVAVIGIIAALVTFTGAKNGGQNFYEWTSSLTSSDIELVTVSKFFGLEQRSYTIPEEDYQGLVNIFNGIEAKDLSNDKPQSENADGYMMALYRDEKLWLFKALADGSVGLMFEDAETGAMYDCEGSLLRIESEALWNYIVKVTDEKATLDFENMTAAQRIQMLDESEIKRVETIPIIENIEPSAHALFPLLKKAVENPLDEKVDMKGGWCLLVHFMNDAESIMLNAGTPENYIYITYQNSLNDEYDMTSSIADTGETFTVYDEDLYNFIRNSFNISHTVSDEINDFLHILDEYIENFIAESNRKTDANFTSADIVQFRIATEWETPKSRYDIYEWDIAFHAEDPRAVYFVDGVWLDSNFRVRDYMQDNYFAVKTDRISGKSEYRILPEVVFKHKQGVDVMYVEAEFGDGFENLLIDLAYNEALTHSDKISKETAKVINNGNGIYYTVEYPVENTDSVVNVIMVRESMSWIPNSSEMKQRISNAPISLAYEEALERMSNLTADDIKYISSNFDPPAEDKMASAMANAVKNAIGSEPYNGVYFWSADVYLSGGPNGYSSNDEHFNLYAGPTENIVAAWYKPEGEGDAVRLCFEDADLYRLIRDIYQTYVHLDENALEPYRHIIDARAQKTIDESKNAVGAQPYTGFEIVRFDHIDEFERSGRGYDVYAWDAAFTCDDPVRAGFAGGMWVDNQLRIRSVDEEIYFVVRDDGEYRFMFWDLYTNQMFVHDNVMKAFE